MSTTTDMHLDPGYRTEVRFFGKACVSFEQHTGGGWERVNLYADTVCFATHLITAATQIATSEHATPEQKATIRQALYNAVTAVSAGTEPVTPEQVGEVLEREAALESPTAHHELRCYARITDDRTAADYGYVCVLPLSHEGEHSPTPLLHPTGCETCKGATV